MLKFEVPQDAAFFSLLNEALHFAETVLSGEKAAKTKTADSQFPWIAQAFGYVGALKAIVDLKKEQESEESLVVPSDNHLHLIHQALLAFGEHHNEEVVESGIQELDGFAIGAIKHSELAELYFGDIENILAKTPSKGKLKAGDLVMSEVDADEEFLQLGEKFYVEGASYPQVEGDPQAGPSAGALDDDDETMEVDLDGDLDGDEEAGFYDDEDEYDDPLADYGTGDDEDNWGYED